MHITKEYIYPLLEEIMVLFKNTSNDLNKKNCPTMHEVTDPEKEVPQAFLVINKQEIHTGNETEDVITEKMMASTIIQLKFQGTNLELIVNGWAIFFPYERFEKVKKIIELTIKNAKLKVGFY